MIGGDFVYRVRLPLDMGTGANVRDGDFDLGGVWG